MTLISLDLGPRGENDFNHLVGGIQIINQKRESIRVGPSRGLKGVYWDLRLRLF